MNDIVPCPRCDSPALEYIEIDPDGYTTLTPIVEVDYPHLLQSVDYETDHFDPVPQFTAYYQCAACTERWDEEQALAREITEPAAIRHIELIAAAYGYE